MSDHKPPRHMDCGRPHWPGACPQENFLKAHVWEKFSALVGWVTFWRNGHE